MQKKTKYNHGYSLCDPKAQTMSIVSYKRTKI